MSDPQGLADIPFLRWLGAEGGGAPGELRLEWRPEFANHLGLWAAGVEFMLAEAAGGHFLAARFPALAGRVLPLLRQAGVRYRRPAEGGRLESRVSVSAEALARFEQELTRRRRAGLTLAVDVLHAGVCVLQADFQWHVQMRDNDGHE